MLALQNGDRGRQIAPAHLCGCGDLENGPRRTPRLTLLWYRVNLPWDMGLEAGSKHCRDVGRNSPAPEHSPPLPCRSCSGFSKSTAAESLRDGESVKPVSDSSDRHIVLSSATARGIMTEHLGLDRTVVPPCRAQTARQARKEANLRYCVQQAVSHPWMHESTRRIWSGAI